MNNITNLKPNIEDLRRRKSRRKMAWISLYSILAITLLLFFGVSETKIEALSSVVDAIVFCLSSIVLGYLGIATYDDLNVMRNKNCKKSLNKNEEAKIDNPDEEQKE